MVNPKTKEAVGPIPHIDFLLSWYGRNLPGTDGSQGINEIKTGGRTLEARIIHGDFKIDNMVRDLSAPLLRFSRPMWSVVHTRNTRMNENAYSLAQIFHPTEARVIGVLDWELSTLGHPFSDLANLLQPHYVPSNLGVGYLAGLRSVTLFHRLRSLRSGTASSKLRSRRP